MSDDNPFKTPFLLSGDPLLEDEDKRQEIYRQVFSTVNGRIVLADILMRAGVALPAFQPGGDANEGFYNSGAHAYALSIAQTAGLHLGRLGRAMVEGTLETMMDKHDDDRNSDGPGDDE